jgi:putative NIF3 family GTP cyclohydrolase 1 type 2
MLKGLQIFRGLKSLTLSDPLQASLLRLSAKGISVFSPHTSLDATPNGINTFLIQPFVGLSKDNRSEVLSGPGETVAGFEGAGMGRRVDLSKPMKADEVVKMVKEHLDLDYGMSWRIRTSRIVLTILTVQVARPDEELAIDSIAVCAGSGELLSR